jgi:hypothetical protein
MKLPILPKELILEIINRLPSDLVLQLYEEANMRIPLKVTKRILEEKLRLQPYNNGIQFKEYSIFLKRYNSYTLDYITGNMSVKKLMVIKYFRYNENIFLNMYIKFDGEELEYNF